MTVLYHRYANSEPGQNTSKTENMPRYQTTAAAHAALTSGDVFDGLVKVKVHLEDIAGDDLHHGSIARCCRTALIVRRSLFFPGVEGVERHKGLFFPSNRGVFLKQHETNGRQVTEPQKMQHDL